MSCSKQKIMDREYAMITFLIGDVAKNGKSAEIGDLIDEDDIIRTSVGSFCDVKIGSSVIRIKQKSKVIISQLVNLKNLEKTEVGLSVGKMLCKPKKLLNFPPANLSTCPLNFLIANKKRKTVEIIKAKVFKNIIFLFFTPNIPINFF